MAWLSTFDVRQPFSTFSWTRTPTLDARHAITTYAVMEATSDVTSNITTTVATTS
jgi:hypothetical protein